MALTKVNTDLLADGGKLNGIEAGADVTDTANVTAAGALMDSELTSIASVKALDQGVATTDSPTFVDVTATSLDISGDLLVGDKIRHAGDTDNYIAFPNADEFRIVTGNAGRIYAYNSQVVINEDSTDTDFRVESDSNTHMLFVDGGNNSVGIGTATNSVGYTLNVGGTIGAQNTVAVVSDGGANYTQGTLNISSSTADTPSARGQGVALFNEGQDTTWYAGTGYNQGGDYHIGWSSGTSLNLSAARVDGADNSNMMFTLYRNNAAVFNELGRDLDFRVESDNNANMLTVDAGADLVTISGGSKVTNERLRVNGAQVVGAGDAGVYTLGISNIFAASAAKYLRIQQDGSLFGGLTITATGDYSNVNAIGCFQKIYSIGANSSNTTLFGAGSVTVADLGATSGQFSMGTPTKPNGTTIYIPLANLNASYILAMSLTIEFRGRIAGISSIDIIDQ
jgi:hypothetical protein